VGLTGRGRGRHGRGAGRRRGHGAGGRRGHGAGGRHERRGQGRRGARAGRPRGEQEGEGKERERERRGGETRLGDPNSGHHRLQTLGHHGERERWKREREVTAWEKSNETNGSGGGGAWGGQGALGARGPDRAGLGRARPHRGSKLTTRTTTKRNPIKS
jgi:hypothetical protein